MDDSIYVRSVSRIGTSYKQKNTIFPDFNILLCNFIYFLCGLETLSFILRVEYRLRIFEKKVLRRLFDSKEDEARGWKENYLMRNFSNFALQQLIRATILRKIR